MNIQEFSALTNISVHTIRYYEKIGLLKHIQRKANGHRLFTKKDIDWIAFIKRLKDMGMSLEKIQQYAELREQGASTFKPRKQLLQEHVIEVEKRIAIEHAHIKKLIEKIDFYDKLIAGDVEA